jgi:hypothetical protein
MIIDCAYEVGEFMNKSWPTKDKDMSTAQRIMEQYANDQNTESLGLFELVVNQKEKRMDFKLSSWVMVLAQHFKSVYGANQGDFVTRSVISHCITRGETLH